MRPDRTPCRCSDAEALSIAELYDEVETALARAFPRDRGALGARRDPEHLGPHRTGHCYIDLVDPEIGRRPAGPGAEGKCWRTHLGPAASARWPREGIELAPGMVVVLRGALDFYRARAEVGFIMAELDVTALLGRLAAERAALLRTLAAEGLLERNRALRCRRCRCGSGSWPVRAPRATATSSAARGVGLRLRGRAWPRRGAGSERAAGGRPGHRPLRDRAGVRPGGRGPRRRLQGRPGGLRHRAGGPGGRHLVRCRCGPGSGTPGTSRWPTSWPTAPSSPRPSAAGSWRSGSRQWWEGTWWPSGRAVARPGTPTCWRRPSRDALARGPPARHGPPPASAGIGAPWTHRARLTTLRSGGSWTTEHRAGHRPRRPARPPRRRPRWRGPATESSRWRRLLAAYDVERQLERGYTLTMDADGGSCAAWPVVAPGDVLVTRFADGIGALGGRSCRRRVAGRGDRADRGA